MKVKSTLGVAAAGGTICLAVLVPFLLIGTFSKAFTGLGLHVDEMYTGGPKVRTITEAGYTIDVHRKVSPHLWQNEGSFVQLDWRSAEKVPAHVSEDVDIDGDGRADVHVVFDVPRGPKARLHAEVTSLNPQYESASALSRERLSRLAVRVDDAILVRVPMK